MEEKSIYYQSRKFDTISLWQDVTAEEWSDPKWQLNNSIRSVEQLSQVIKLSDYQKNEIERTISELRNQGKETLRITPYYASLMAEDPFNPQMLEGEKGEQRLDPIFWQSVPTPANLMFTDTGVE